MLSFFISVGSIVALSSLVLPTLVLDTCPVIWQYFYPCCSRAADISCIFAVFIITSPLSSFSVLVIGLSLHLVICVFGLFLHKQA
ncbi:hypothetical protein Plhal304r1_c005g0020551 [Plasmopara halstedii]